MEAQRHIAHHDDRERYGGVTSPGGSLGTTPSDALSVDADLDISVGDCSARLEGKGQRMVLRCDYPHLLWPRLTEASLPDEIGNVSGVRSVGRVATAMSEAGIHLDVEGPDGIIVSLGHGKRSLVGRVVTGSGSVKVRSVRSLVPFVGVVIAKVRHQRSR